MRPAAWFRKHLVSTLGLGEWVVVCDLDWEQCYDCHQDFAAADAAAAADGVAFGSVAVDGSCWNFALHILIEGDLHTVGSCSLDFGTPFDPKLDTHRGTSKQIDQQQKA